MGGRRWAVTAIAALAAAAHAAPPAHAATHHLTYTSPAFTIGDFEVQLPKVRVRSPHRSGYVTHMSAILIDGKGRRLSMRHVMLHHLVFLNDGPTVGGAPKGSCAGRYGEPFYGTGEEHQQLRLPAGDGYRVAKADRWRLQAMLMSHDIQTHRVRIRYSFTFVTGRRMSPVRPFWIRANGCNSEQPSYTVQQTGGPGAIQDRKWTWKVPFNGRIVAAGGHLHGGSVNMTLTQPRCADRTLLDTRPLYGNPDYLAYRIRPILHEPGPKNTRYFISRTGIPVRKGELLDLHGFYDASHPRARVMSILHVYLVRTKTAPAACLPLPADVHEIADRNGRLEPPYEPIPFSKVTASGKPYTIPEPEGAFRSFEGNANVNIQGIFTPAIVSIPQGSSVTWKFSDPIGHNVLFASGPRVIGSPTLSHGATHTSRFSVPGTYKFICYLHPVTMHQEVIVRPADEGIDIGA